MKSIILKNVERYYSQKIEEHGAVPAGVDWNSEDSQLVRFDQLLKVTSQLTDAFSLLDFGCGYGALYEFMKPRIGKFNYSGYDISESMIMEAKKSINDEVAKFTTNIDELVQHDVTVASGIFNVKQNSTEEDWFQYVKETLFKINLLSLKGFSFNMLTSYSDSDRKRNYLYYPNPCDIFDFCKKEFSKEVALLHDYNLYEFTILVRKP